MKNTFYRDDAGNVVECTSLAPGMTIIWRHGNQYVCEPEDVIRAAADRLEFLQAGPQACDYYADALRSLEDAIRSLAMCRADRIIQHTLDSVIDPGEPSR